MKKRRNPASRSAKVARPSSTRSNPKRRRRRNPPAATRKVRRANPKRRRRSASISLRANPKRRRRRRNAATTTTRRRPNPKRKYRRLTVSLKNPRHRRRRRNPGFRESFGGFVGQLKDVLKMGAVVVPVLAVQNALGNIEIETTVAGVTQKVKLRQKVGPLFDVAASALALWAVPRFVLKGPLAAYRTPGVYGLSALLLFNGLRALVWYARRGWDSDKAEIPAGTTGYPTWTDLLSLPEPAKALSGYPGYYGQPQLGAAQQMYGFPFPDAIETIYDPVLGGYVPAFQQAAWPTA